MTSYTIKITYETGDSFGSSTEVSEVGQNWNDLAQAKVALKFIQAHYEATVEEREWRQPKPYSTDHIKDQPWFDEGEYSDMWKYGLKVPSDDGESVNISAFWVGYFECLLGAEIVLVDDPEMKYTP